ncbi:protein kinase domain-containing protein [Kovacikia minuta]|uniref:protein kinase domain-containing protein n=1 Tax=Kovacikia minuta TaxID=2931930 RepID=UPI0020C7BAE8|nr:protein kinase [Kovacikia minuta]
MRDLLPVLEYLHKLNLIHRDIAPDNIMFSRDRGLPILIDFGLVKDSLAWSVDTATSGYVRQTSRLGKSGYSPPEQLGMGHCYPCSDLYALGVTAIVLLTGKNPNTLVDPQTLQWTWRSHVKLKTSLGQILDKLIMSKPKDRFQSAREVLEAMQTLPQAEERPQLSLATQALHQAEKPQGKQLAASVGLATPSSPPPLSSISSAAFMEQCRQELTRCVGPIARFLIDDTLNHYPDITPQGFIEVLTSQISDLKQANDFRTRIQIPQELTSGGQPFLPSGSKAPKSEDPCITQQNYSTPPSAAPNDAFVESCRQELTRCIGPIAKVLIKQVVTDNPHLDRTTLIEVLASQIPNPKLAAEFRQRLKNL